MQPTPDNDRSSEGGEVIPLPSMRGVDPAQRGDLALLRALVDAVTRSGDVASAAQSILDVLTQGLGLGSGTIALLQTAPEGRRQLVPTASAGPQSPLLREMPPIDVDSSYEAAVVFTESQPHYVADMHGEGPAAGQDRSEESEPVGRWRSLISTKSYAVLPLCAGPRPIGVMTLQWPDSREFDTHITDLLETVSAVAAVALDRWAGRERDSSLASFGDAGATGGTASDAAASAIAVAPSSSGADMSASVHTPVGPLRLEVTADGVLMPLAPGASPSEEGLLSLEITLADARCVVWDASTPHPGIVVVLIASFSDAETADALRERLVQTKRVCARQDMTTAETLALLNGVVVASASPGVAVPAWLGSIDTRTGAFTQCGVGETDVLVHSAGDRTWVPELGAPPLGTSGRLDCDEDVQLLLSGDRVMVRLGDAELRVARP